MEHTMYRFINVLIMPTDYCNMNCVYCFNNRKHNLKKQIMSFDVLEKIFSITIPYYDEVRFIWHGGEPTSVGMDFYIKAIELQKKYNVNRIQIYNSIQTNLTLIDEKFASFLIENNFHIGSSYDGTNNESTRHNSKRIMEGYELIKKCGGHNGFIYVVQNNNIDILLEDYKWFKQNNINYTLNMYLNEDDVNDPLNVSKEKVVEKICEFFDYWMYDDECNINISYFEDFIRFILFKEKQVCCYNSCLGKNIGIRYDGTIFNCNRDFPEKLNFGNVSQYINIRECFQSEGFINLLQLAVERRKKCKSSCEIFDFCAGGCNSVANVGGNISDVNSRMCYILKNIYLHIENKINEFILNYDRNTKGVNPYFISMIKKN